MLRRIASFAGRREDCSRFRVLYFDIPRKQREREFQMTERDAIRDEGPEAVREENDEPDVEAHQLREQVREAVRNEEPGAVRDAVRDN